MKRRSSINAHLSRGAVSFCAVGGLMLATALVSAPACAQPTVEGTAQTVRVEGHGATLDEIMTALGRSFNLHFTSSGELNQTVTGTYEGSLKRVVARLLSGHNFILSTHNGRVDVAVFDAGGASQAVASSKARARHPGVAQAGRPVTPKTAASTAAQSRPKVMAKEAPAVPTPAKQPATGTAAPLIRLADGSGTVPAPMPVQGGGQGPELRPSKIEPPKLTHASAADVPMAKPAAGGTDFPHATKPAGNDAPEAKSTGNKPPSGK